jgi:hypothetical protein
MPPTSARQGRWLIIFGGSKKAGDNKRLLQNGQYKKKVQECDAKKA